MGSMDEKDHVFARFQDNKTATSDRRETLTIPRRAGATGSRVVEVVHVKSGGAGHGHDRPRRLDAHVRSASWDGGFPAKQTALPAPEPEPTVIEAAAPTVHVMPAWEPAVTVAPAPDEAPAALAAPPRPRSREQVRRVADPFDLDDDGANCMRCGYAIEAAREKRGLLTCAACGQERG